MEQVDPREKVLIEFLFPYLPSRSLSIKYSGEQLDGFIDTHGVFIIRSLKDSYVPLVVDFLLDESFDRLF
ncbi:hypothetical protein [uncultured Porphyromonas sp.]|uniref:hypothetical protein n=1 Tax=uncultured Porphyromonas sp. TaxID=159274 RepID=UPI002604AF9E|nr:hypothetical protein [uncultured Porphyromonas sp.]